MRVCAHPECAVHLDRRNVTGLCRDHLRRLQMEEGSDWPASDIAALCDLIADGSSFGAAAKALGKTKNSITSRWHKIVRLMGAQAA